MELRAAGYVAGVVLLPVVPIISLVTALAGPAVAGSPSPTVSVSPVLTSTPFGAAAGQPVTHTVTLSGTGAATAVRVTFTTTVDLDGVTATPSQGGCPVVTTVRVVCEFGAVDLSRGAATPTMTISGTVHPGTAPGTLVQNVVAISAPGHDGDPANDVVSNAYLVAAGTTASPPAKAGGTDAPRPPRNPNHAQASPLSTVGAGMVLFGLAMSGLILWRRRRGS